MPLHTFHRSTGSNSSSEGDASAAYGIPLLSFSRTPSPSPHTSSYVTHDGVNTPGSDQDEDEDYDEDEEDAPLSLRRLGDRVVNETRAWDADWRRSLRAGGIGQFLFGSWAGWHAWVAVLVLLEASAAFAVTALMRVILWTGVYKFPYPVTVTFLQLLFTHILLVIGASVTRAAASPLRRFGLQSLVAPSDSNTSSREVTTVDSKGVLALLDSVKALRLSRGIAGNGLFEFDRGVAWACAPVTVVYIGKTVLSNISYAYGILELYTVARIATVPVTLVLTGVFTRTTHSISTLSATLIATLNLLMACIRPGMRVTWESIVAGIFSSFFVALYPILLNRIHRQISMQSTTQAETVPSVGLDHHAANGSTTPAVTPYIGWRLNSIAYWRVLHYVSSLSVATILPFVILSNEVPSILRNCYFLDVFWFWFLILVLSFASAVLFGSTLALVRATSPLTANFVKLPRHALQLAVLSKGRMPVHAWVGCAFTWVTSLWYAIERREEGRGRERRRLERG